MLEYSLHLCNKLSINKRSDKLLYIKELEVVEMNGVDWHVSTNLFLSQPYNKKTHFIIITNYKNYKTNTIEYLYKE